MNDFKLKLMQFVINYLRLVTEFAGILLYDCLCFILVSVYLLTGFVDCKDPSNGRPLKINIT